MNDRFELGDTRRVEAIVAPLDPAAGVTSAERDPSSETLRLFHEHAPSLYRFCCVTLGRPDDAEDVVQETYLKLIQHLEKGGTVLGMFDTLPYEEGLAELRQGDTLLVFSDGVTETFNLEGDEFGEGRLVEIAARGRGLDATALQSEILRELDRFSSGAKASDDRTLIVLKRY